MEIFRLALFEDKLMRMRYLYSDFLLVQHKQNEIEKPNYVIYEFYYPSVYVWGRGVQKLKTRGEWNP